MYLQHHRFFGVLLISDDPLFRGIPKIDLYQALRDRTGVNAAGYYYYPFTTRNRRLIGIACVFTHREEGSYAATATLSCRYSHYLDSLTVETMPTWQVDAWLSNCDILCRRLSPLELLITIHSSRTYPYSLVMISFHLH